MAGRDKKATARRDFLKLAGLSGVAAAAAAVGTKPEAEAAAPKSPTAAGYRETEHVKKAYALARF